MMMMDGHHMAPRCRRRRRCSIIIVIILFCWTTGGNSDMWSTTRCRGLLTLGLSIIGPVQISLRRSFRLRQIYFHPKHTHLLLLSLTYYTHTNSKDSTQQRGRIIGLVLLRSQNRALILMFPGVITDQRSIDDVISHTRGGRIFFAASFS
jgi:hypothetical protein